MTHKASLKRIWGGLLALFMAVMLLATYVSQQIHLRSLPTIETVFESRQSLRNTYTVQATVAFDTLLTLRAPCALTVETVQKRAGEAVRRGEALFAYALDDLQLALLAAQKDAELYGQQAAQAPIGSAARKWYQQQAENGRDTATQLQELIAQDGIVSSPVGGYVDAVYVAEGDRLAQNGRVLSVCDQSGAIELQFESPDAQYDFSSVTAELPVRNGKSVETQAQQMTITRRRYDAASRTLRYSASLPKGLSMDAYPGQTVTGTLQTQSVAYEHTLPIGCLHEDSTGRQYVYVVSEKETVRGKVLYAQERTVYVLDQDAVSFAYTTLISEPVVMSNTQQLSDLCEVKTLS